MAEIEAMRLMRPENMLIRITSLPMLLSIVYEYMKKMLMPENCWKHARKQPRMVARR